MKSFNKVNPWLIAVLLILWITLTESPFQKGGVGEAYLIFITGFVMLIATLLAMRYKKSDILERLVIAIVFAVASLLLISMYVMPPIIDSMYSDKTWFFWETKHRIFINFVYYGSIVADLIISFWVYFRFNIKTRRKNKKPQPIPS
jgi:hypothetical protein